MFPELHEIPTQAELDRIKMNARQMQAEAIRAAFRTLLGWVVRPMRLARHA